MSWGDRSADTPHVRIAIVGTACLLPGARTVEEFWQVLLDGRDNRSVGTEAQFGTDESVDGGWGDTTHRIKNKRGGFIDPATPLRLDGLAIPEQTLRGYDRTAQWSIDVARRALEGVALSPRTRARTGVVLGSYSFPTLASNAKALPHFVAAQARGLRAAGLPVQALADAPDSPAANLWPFGLPATATAAALQLAGPRIALDAACSSALYSLYLAAQWLAVGAADAVVAGAVCAPDPLLINLSFSDLGAYPPPDGISQPFDAGSQGILTGQGAGVFVLKRYADAVAAGDLILAELAGGALSNDGAGNHPLVPSRDGQRATYDLVYREPHTRIDYLECHATGTPRGDRTELSGLAEWWRAESANGDAVRRLPVGSVKGNVGHLLTVAGFTSALKVVLSLRHGVIPPTPGVRNPVTDTMPEVDNIEIVREAIPWPGTGGVAGVSAFGFGGANAHVVLARPGDPATAGTPVAPGSSISRRRPLAVRGVGVVLGDAAGFDEFTTCLFDGATRTSRSPRRWHGIDGPDVENGLWATGFDVDPSLLKIPPADLARSNPQQGAIFEVAVQALADYGVGHVRSETGRVVPMPQRRIAIVAAIEMSSWSHARRARFEAGAYLRKVLADNDIALDDEDLGAVEDIVRDATLGPLSANEVLSYTGNMPASRISQAFNLTGPAFTVAADAAVAVTALEVASLLLLSESIEAVLVAAADFGGDVETVRVLRERGIETTPVDSAVALLLTRACDADRESGTVIEGADVTASLRSTGGDLATTVTAAARASAAAVEFDSGTADLVVVTAPADLAGAMLAGYPAAAVAAGPLLTSVEPVVGSTGTVAPLLGVAAVAAVARTATTPPSRIDGTVSGVRESGVRLRATPSPVITRDGARALCAVVASCDPLLHTVSHVCVRAALPQRERGPRPVGRPPLVVLRARSIPGLVQRVQALHETLSQGGEPDLVRDTGEGEVVVAFVALDLAALRKDVATAVSELAEVLGERGSWSTPAGSAAAARPIGGKVALVYPGAFTTYPSLDDDIFRVFPDLIPAIYGRDGSVATLLGDDDVHPAGVPAPGRREMMAAEGRLLQSVPAMLTVGTTHAALMTEALRDIMSVPVAAAYGYSLGESSMLFATKVWQQTPEAVRKLYDTALFKTEVTNSKDLVRRAWNLGDDVPDAKVWATRVVLTDADTVRAALAGEKRVFLTHVNSPGEVVIAGFAEDVVRVAEGIGAPNVAAPANFVMHCAVVDPAREELEYLNTHPVLGAADSLQRFTSHTGGAISAGESSSAIAARIATTLTNTVDFVALTRNAYAAGVRTFIEVGPGGTCTRWIGATLAGTPHLALAADQRASSVRTAMIRLAAQLIAHGVPVRLDALMPDTRPAEKRPVVQIQNGGPSISERIAAEVSELAPAVRQRTPVQSAPSRVPAEAPAAVPEAPVAPAADPEAVPVLTPPVPAAVSTLPSPAAVRRRTSVQRTSFPVPAAPAEAPSVPAATPEAPSAPAAVPEAPMAAMVAPGAPGASAAAPETVPVLTPLVPAAVSTPPSPAAVPASAAQSAVSTPPAPQPAPPALPIPTPDPKAETLTHAKAREAVPAAGAVHAETAPQPAPAVPPTTSAEPEVTVDSAVAKREVVAALTAQLDSVHMTMMSNAMVHADAMLTALETDRGMEVESPAALGVAAAPTAAASTASAPAVPAPAAVAAPVFPAGAPGTFTHEQLLEFATGSIAAVFGPEYAVIDTYPRRVRLPEEPYHFVSRVTAMNGKLGEYVPSSIVTEYDIPRGAWYSIDGITPAAVTIEAGQCDLLLISYLGIDLKFKGTRVYRLLDSTLVFHDYLPQEGQTLRFEITIERFVWSKDNLIFFFNYKCFADDVHILSLLDASAGFFSDEQLATPMGVVDSPADVKRRNEFTPTWFKPVAYTDKTALSAAEVNLLAQGEIGRVFGPDHDKRGASPSLRLPGDMLRMITTVDGIERKGGPRNIGKLWATKNLEPDGWYFRSHFTGDPVLAGSLMAEGAVQLLHIYAMYLGLHLLFPDGCFQCVPGEEISVRVRGQTVPKDASIRYCAEIIDIRFLPRPTIMADVTIYDGDKPIVSIQNLGISVKEKPGTDYRPGPGGVAPFLGRRDKAGNPVLVNEFHLANAAKGDLGIMMGPEFDIYAGRRAPHIPNGVFQYVDRIMSMQGTRGVLKPGATQITEYDSAPDAWYDRESGTGHMPNAVLLESSLQAAIVLGYYLGATLEYPDDTFAIRNLDGHADLLSVPDLRGKTIRQHTTLTMHQKMPGTVLQRFEYELETDGVVFYRGQSLFGYFTDEALSVQLGLDNGTFVAPWIDRQAIGGRRVDMATWRAAYGDAEPAIGSGRFDLIDSLDIVTTGGEKGLGYARALREIRPEQWFFGNHFYKDPVMPGSLGIEAAFQALKILVIELGLARNFRNPVFSLAPDVRVRWIYRGQIGRHDGQMQVDVAITEVRTAPDGSVTIVSDANVWKPQLRIYNLQGLAIRVIEG